MASYHPLGKQSRQYHPLADPRSCARWNLFLWWLWDPASRCCPPQSPPLPPTHRDRAPPQQDRLLLPFSGTGSSSHHMHSGTRSGKAEQTLQLPSNTQDTRRPSVRHPRTKAWQRNCHHKLRLVKEAQGNTTEWKKHLGFRATCCFV